MVTRNRVALATALSLALSACSGTIPPTDASRFIQDPADTGGVMTGAATPSPIVSDATPIPADTGGVMTGIARPRHLVLHRDTLAPTDPSPGKN
jgi:hypothetical protein